MESQKMQTAYDNQQDCPANHDKLVIFDAKQAKSLLSSEIRKRWPRIECHECNTILYSSIDHYVAGDW